MARRTHCPEGRPLYRAGEVPAGLATRTALRQQRRRPAPGQEPAATLLYYGNQYVPLYAIDGTEQLPPLSPGRKARYEAIRTCWRCRLRRDQPWEPAPGTKQRLCPDCAEAEAEASWWQNRNQARAAAAAWAAGVLADPDAVLLHCVRDGTDLTLTAYAILPADRDHLPAGTVVLDAKLGHEDAEDVRAVADQIRALADRRIVPWTHWPTGPDVLAWAIETHLGAAPDLHVKRGPYTWKPGSSGDELGLWYAEWLGVRAGDGSWRYDRNIRSQVLSAVDPKAAVERMYELLRYMAVDDHPAGPPRCPGLIPGTRDVCGAGTVRPDTGLCPSCSAAEASGAPQ